MASTNFKVIGAQIGILKGVHDQYIRPETVSASEDDINRLFKSTRAFTDINANIVGGSNLNSLTESVSVRAKRIGTGWDKDTSLGSILVDQNDGGVVSRHMINFFINSKAIINGEVVQDATLYLNSCTKVDLTTGGLRKTQADIIQRLQKTDGTTVLSNRVTDRINATPEATGDNVILSADSQGESVVGQSTTLVADDALAATLSALDKSARTLGNRYNEVTRSNGAASDATLASICDGAQATVDERNAQDNDLIQWMMDSTQGSARRMSIQLDELQRILSHFQFFIIEEEVGDLDFTTTAKMSTRAGAMVQSIVNTTIGLMQRHNVYRLRFFATNVDGHIEMEVADNWFEPMQVSDVEGLDMDQMELHFRNVEATIRAQIEAQALPRAMIAPDTEVLLDIEYLTYATATISFAGRKEVITIPSALTSAWSSINTGMEQLANNAHSQKNILKAIVSNAQSLGDQ